MQNEENKFLPYTQGWILWLSCSIYIKVRILRYINTDRVKTNIVTLPKRILHDKQKEELAKQ